MCETANSRSNCDSLHIESFLIESLGMRIIKKSSISFPNEPGIMISFNNL